MNSAWLDAGLLGRVRRILRPWPCHLVGGAVRDHLLGRAPHDLDLVVAGGDEPAVALAESLPARLVRIGGDRFAAIRLVGENFAIDLWDRGAMILDDELARRDLTINAIAVALTDGAYHDPHGGRRDLEKRRLRATTAESFADDPLRILRLARLAAELRDFTVDPRTHELAMASLPALPSVAAERRREEFGRALRSECPERALEIWTSLGLYPGLLGVDEVDAGSRAQSALERSKDLAGRFTLLSRELAVEPTPDPDPLVLNGALLVASAGAEVQTLLESGYVVRREARDIALTLEHRSLPREPEAQRWLLHRAAHVWPTAVCFAAATDDGTTPEDIAARLEHCLGLVHREGESIFDPPPLLRGNEIRELLDLRSGPEVGLASRRLRRRQIEGRLRDREEAEAWLLGSSR